MKNIFSFLICGWFLYQPILSHAFLIQEKNCVSCHRFSQKENEKKGPDLFYAGNKFKIPWLEKYLQNPVTLRKAGTIHNPDFLKGEHENKHPSLLKEEAEKITQELIEMTLPDLPVEDIQNTLTKAQKAKTKYEFERTFSCISCHQSLNLAGKPRGGISGPSLVNAGNRLEANWVAIWLKNPKTFSQKSRMPVYKMDDETRLRFTQFIMTFKNENIR